MQMFNAEVTGITHDKLRPRISQTAKSLWLIYFTLTVILFLLLYAGPMEEFDAVCYAFSIMSTGGFATSDEGLGLWRSDYIEVVATFFMFIGGVSFTLIYRAVHRDFKAVWQNDVFLYLSRHHSILLRGVCGDNMAQRPGNIGQGCHTRPVVSRLCQ